MNLSKLSGHKFALQFSGGKDSLACLYLLKPVWDRLIVLWGNPGDEFPETHRQMEHVKTLVAEFHEVRGNSERETAYPVDLLPLRNTPMGQGIEPEGSKVTLQSKFDCCFRNFWIPMAQKVKDLGITLLIRGQRNSEFLRSPIQKGVKDISGAEIWLPIEEWSAEDVFEYLRRQKVQLPVFYQYMNAGPKCMLCTAWLKDQRGKAYYLKRFHPEKSKEYERRMKVIRQAIADDNLY